MATSAAATILSSSSSIVQRRVTATKSKLLPLFWFLFFAFAFYAKSVLGDNNGVKRGRGTYYNDETYGVVPFKNEGTGVVIDSRWIKFANKGSAEFWSEYVHIREKLLLGKDEHGNKIDVGAELKRLQEQFRLAHPLPLPPPPKGATYAPILDYYFYAFVAECLNESPIDGECTTWASKNDFGTMPNWNTRFVTDMAGMDTTTSIAKGFSKRSTFNGDISTWNVSSVTNMRGMFFKLLRLINQLEVGTYRKSLICMLCLHQLLLSINQLEFGLRQKSRT